MEKRSLMADQRGSYSQQGGQDGRQSPAPGDGVQSPQQDTRPAHGGKKRRAYAGQAFDIGTGANAGAGGQPPSTGSYPSQQSAPQYGGYPQQPQAQQQQGYAAPAYQNTYGQQAGYGTASYSDQYQQGGAPAQAPAQSQSPYQGGGYAPPDQGYPGGGQGGTAGMTQQFGQMNMGGQPAGRQGAVQLNRLQTTDLISQPFQVPDIDVPPPAIVLPPNVSLLPVKPLSS